MSDNANTDRELGRMQAQIRALEKGQDSINAKIDVNTTITNSIDQKLTRLVGEQAGAWKVVVGIGGLGSAIGGAIVWILTHMKVTA